MEPKWRFRCCGTGIEAGRPYAHFAPVEMGNQFSPHAAGRLHLENLAAQCFKEGAVYTFTLSAADEPEATAS